MMGDEAFAIGWERIEQLSQERPSDLGLVFEDGQGWTFSEMADEIEAWATEFSEVGERQLVALYMPTGPQLVFALHAIWKLGAVPLLINQLYQRKELLGAIATRRPRMILWGEATAVDPQEVQTALADYEVKELSPLLGTRIPKCYVETDRFPNAQEDLRDVVDNDSFVIVLTGGTTGVPKQVVLAKSGTVDRIAVQSRGQSSGGPRRGPDREITHFNIVCFPLFHMAGLKALLFAWAHGRSVVLMSRFEAKRYTELVKEFRVDNLFLFPTMIYDLLDDAIAPDALRGVKHALTGGQRLSEELRKAFQSKFDVPILNSYGSTEAGAIAGWSRADVISGNWDPAAVGRIYPGVELRVVDPEGNVLPLGSQGQIEVRTTASQRYIGVEGQDEGLFRNGGWLRTGDLGHASTDGFLYLAGREKELMKVGGFQVWPGEIEEALKESALVSDVVVVRKPDDRLGEVPVAFIVPSEDAPASETEIARTVIEFARRKLAKFKAPRQVVVVERIPRTDTGKVAIGLLQERLQRQSDGE